MNSSDVQEMEHLINELTKTITIIIASGQDNLKMLIKTKEDIIRKINQIQGEITYSYHGFGLTAFDGRHSRIADSRIADRPDYS
jgi:hypothetical protein